jgi:heme A synthase
LPGPDALRRFRLLVDGAILSTVLLVVMGGVVRVADAGLGCGPAGSGLHGWPLCRGSLLPAGQVHTILEYTHRFLAALVAILLVAILWQALRRLHDRPALVWGAAAASLLIVLQALLGALTVEQGLDTALVATHLGVAMILLALLVGLSLASRGRWPSSPGPRSLRATAALASVLLLATIVAGGVVAGTERHGTPGGERANGAHMACGNEFPSCNGAFLPFGEGEMVDVQLVHRIAMFLAVVAIAALAWLLRRQRLEGLALAIALVLTAQVWLGAMNVWVGKDAVLVVAHLAVATLLWLLVVTAFLLTGSPARRSQPHRHDQPLDEAPAPRPDGARPSVEVR